MKKKKLWLVTGVAAAAVLAAGTVTFAYQSGSDSEEQAVYKEVTVEKGNLTAGVTENLRKVTSYAAKHEARVSEDSSSASTQNNSSAQNSAGENATSSTSTASTLEVETVYVTAGQTVAEGDPILKLTEESVASYKKDLEEAVTEAKTAVSEAGLSAEKQKVSASYSYNLSTAEGSVAQETYKAAIKQLQEAVDDAQEAVDTSASLINYYQEQIDAGVDLSASLTEEQKNYDKLYTKLVAAKNNYTTKSIEAEKTLKEAELSAKNASSQYSVDVSGADNDITDAKDTLSDAEEALEAFEAAIGDDGTIYAEYTGTITDLSYEAGDTISSGATVATFSNADAVTITVSVSEEDITNIAVGDVVEIELSAYEDQTFAGVDSIDTSSSSGSSTVSYNVTAAFAGDITGIYTDMTGNVTFISRQVTDVLYVSNKAVQFDGTTSYVKVKDADGTIRMVDVETGFSDGVNVEITSGLTEGETVLIESQVTE